MIDSFDQLSEFDQGWVTALIEGEGCFSVSRSRKRSRTYFYATFQLRMCDHDIVRRLRDLLEIDRNLYICGTRSTNHRPAMLLTLSGEPAVRLMQMVLPYMGERRSARIEEILSSTPRMTGIRTAAFT